jgi:hypothetical protein
VNFGITALTVFIIGFAIFPKEPRAELTEGVNVGVKFGVSLETLIGKEDVGKLEEIIF